MDSVLAGKAEHPYQEKDRIKTNIGEFIAGAYYQACLNAWPVIYNQPIYFKEPCGSSVCIDVHEFRVGCSKADIEVLTDDELAIEKRESDVIALSAGTMSGTCDVDVKETNAGIDITLFSKTCFIHRRVHGIGQPQ